MEKRLEELERRVARLEDEAKTPREEEMLLSSYGTHVGKSTAAQILGVSRATIYAMIADGRLDSACDGRNVNVRSIARYICSTGRRQTREGIDCKLSG